MGQRFWTYDDETITHAHIPLGYAIEADGQGEVHKFAMLDEE